MEIKKYTITVFAENKPGVLYRIADLFLRRKINVDSLTVSEIEIKGSARFTIVVSSDAVTVEKIVKQLYRIIEVFKVFENVDKDLLFKEVAMIKVSTANAQKRNEIKDITHIAKAEIIHMTPEYVVVEKTGSEEEINSLFDLLKPFGIKEFIRSGRIAIVK